MKRIFSTEGDYYEHEFDLISVTERALLVNDGTVQAWVPKSQVMIDGQTDGKITLVLPAWLAVEKGFV